jgi:small GTP-binding protein
MIKKKITMLGAFAVGKTSLVQRFVNSIFSEKYQTTIGVKIDQKMVEVDDKLVTLMLWDLYGEDDFLKVKSSYLMGSSGYLLVADGTRAKTLDVAISLQKMASEQTQNAPFIFILNKTDLNDLWEIDAEAIDNLRKAGWEVILTSAKENFRVEEAFQKLSTMMLQHK